MLKAIFDSNDSMKWQKKKSPPLIKFSAYRARQSSVFFSFSSVISFKMRINTDESVLVGGSGNGSCVYAWRLVFSEEWKLCICMETCVQ